MIEIRLLDGGDVENAAILFDLYRQFYSQPPDYNAAHEFISTRLSEKDSFLIGAFISNVCVGFTQLYPSFSSVSLKRKLILNDMFVIESHRQKGVAYSLLRAAENLARSISAGSLVLATQKENSAAKALYESAGWVAESKFDYYNRVLASGT